MTALEIAAASKQAEDRLAVRRARRIGVAVLAFSTAISLLAVTISLVSATTRADDVARQISADVSASVVQDARQSRILTGRTKLAEANGRLLGRGLPVVPDPGPMANGDELLVQAARAAVLADLPDSIVADLRRQLAGRDAFPSSLGVTPRGGLADGVVTTLPISPARPTLVEVPAPSSAAPPGRDPSPPTTRAPVRTPAAPAPAPSSPAPEPTPGRRLLPLLPGLPLDVPLLSE